MMILKIVIFYCIYLFLRVNGMYSIKFWYGYLSISSSIGLILGLLREDDENQLKRIG